MQVTIWGSRGTLASPGPETIRYGGQTSCVSVWLDDGSLIVLDAGTGIRPFGLSLEGRRPARVDLLITHLHTDHIEGLRFFAPFWDPDVRFRVWGPPATHGRLAERIAPSFAPPFFPVHLRDVPSRPTFDDAPPEPWRIGSATVTAALIKHPGPAVGYRLEEDGHVLAYLPDHEPGLGCDLATTDPAWISGYALAAGANVLLHDGQYRDDEYAARPGWGHSSVSDTVTFAERTGVERLVLFHHDPMHTDEDLDGMLAHARARSDLPIELATEGRTFELSGS